MSKKFSEWFSGWSKPKLPGVYETDAFGVRGYQHWNGKKWGLCAARPYEALGADQGESFIQKPNWRGLASDPNQQAGK
jgi:hypothetical protein